MLHNQYSPSIRMYAPCSCSTTSLIHLRSILTCFSPCTPLVSTLLGQPKQQVDVTQADDGDIQSEFIDRQLPKGSHLMMGISKEKSLRTNHQWGHQYIHASGATLDNRWTYNPFIFGHGFPKTKARILGFGNVRVRNAELVSELILELILELLMEFTDDQTEMIKETVVKAIAGTIMAMIAELTGDWVRDWIGNQSEMISELVSELVLELVSELIPKLIGDPDGCPLTYFSLLV